MNIFSDNFEGYGGRYFFIPSVALEVKARELEAKNVKDATTEAKKYGHGSVAIEIVEV